MATRECDLCTMLGEDHAKRPLQTILRRALMRGDVRIVFIGGVSHWVAADAGLKPFSAVAPLALAENDGFVENNSDAVVDLYAAFGSKFPRLNVRSEAISSLGPW
ncbi:hypothetical protein UFOVP708_17 [uncultured Caudovirales phage]|uniref:Uncharacterized protein n=1 Tax=uncultured Caudovirales phage TaxID=2100421 RepID=A0A6J5NLT2_9CAUD|nr:hypothetical protein UFOVP708_17 [uncultured Caudovirales phage]